MVRLNLAHNDFAPERVRLDLAHKRGQNSRSEPGVDVCYTNHAEADADDMDDLLTLLGVAGVSFVITVPGADDVMLGYQSLSFHDVPYARQVLGLRVAPEFERWLQGLGMADQDGRVLATDVGASPLRALTGAA